MYDLSYFKHCACIYSIFKWSLFKKFSILTNTHLYSLLDLVRHKIGRKNPNLVKDGINR